MDAMPDHLVTATVDASAVATPLRVPRAAELVARHLRNQIVRGELREGDRLPPLGQILTQFGVSRPTLREALRTLEEEGLLVVQRGVHGGARIKSPSGEAAAGYAGLVLQYRGATLADVYEARKAIELPAIRQLATDPVEGAIERLRDSIERARAHIDDPAEGIRLQEEFHLLLVEVTGSKTLALFQEILHAIVDVHSAAYVARMGGQAHERQGAHRGSRAHERLLELVVAGHYAQAEELWIRHLDEGAENRLRASDTRTVLDLLS
jgi:DNA-binding FadR family transcriptional regulator